MDFIESSRSSGSVYPRSRKCVSAFSLSMCFHSISTLWLSPSFFSRSSIRFVSSGFSPLCICFKAYSVCFSSLSSSSFSFKALFSGFGKELKVL